jgi:hypothetical protein
VLCLLSACASVPEQEARSISPLLQQISATATGDFATSLDETDPALLLTVSTEPMVPGSRTLVLNLFQQTADAAPRRFRMALSETSPGAAFPLIGVLATLDPNGRAIAECPLVVRTGSMGLNVSPEAATCQFGTGEERLGLTKEMWFSGAQVRVADRVLRLSGSEPEDVSVSELRFFRLNRYSGWVGVLEGDEWRIARDIQLDTANGSLEPVDAAGMTLGVIVQLDQTVLPGGSQPAIVRLTVLDARENRTLARTWSEPGARRIGLATPEVQVGLERDRAP